MKGKRAIFSGGGENSESQDSLEGGERGGWGLGGDPHQRGTGRDCLKPSAHLSKQKKGRQEDYPSGGGATVLCRSGGGKKKKTKKPPSPVPAVQGLGGVTLTARGEKENLRRGTPEKKAEEGWGIARGEKHKTNQQRWWRSQFWTGYLTTKRRKTCGELRTKAQKKQNQG